MSESTAKPARQKFWMGSVPEFCQVTPSLRIVDRMVDGRVPGHGSWANMHPTTFRRLGGRIGPGNGQLYAKQPDGRWLKIEG
jgi:hypothetical protein